MTLESRVETLEDVAGTMPSPEDAERRAQIEREVYELMTAPWTPQPHNAADWTPEGMAASPVRQRLAAVFGVPIVSSSGAIFWPEWGSPEYRPYPGRDSTAVPMRQLPQV